MPNAASPTTTSAHGLRASHSRPPLAPPSDAPQTPFSALMDAGAPTDPAPPAPPAAKPQTPASASATPTKPAKTDTPPKSQDSSTDTAAASSSADVGAGGTATTGITSADTKLKDGTAKDAKAKIDGVTVGAATVDTTDPAAKPDNGADTQMTAAVVTTPVAPTPTIALAIPPATLPEVAPSATGGATAGAAIAGVAPVAGAATAPAAADAAVVGDALSAGAAGTTAAGQGPQPQNLNKLAAAGTAPNADAAAANPTNAQDTAAVDANGSTQSPLTAAGPASGGDSDAATVNGASPHPVAHPGKDSAVGEKSLADRADALTNAQGDALAAPASDVHAQQGSPAAPLANQAPIAVLQSAGPATADPTAAASASAPQLQAAATAAAVPLAGVAVEIVARAQAASNRFEIRLDPPDLGRIDVRLNVDKQGNVTSHLVVERSATLDMLRRDAPQLERALQDAGLKTGGDGLQFSLSDQGAGAQNQSFQDNSGARIARLTLPTEDVTVVETARSYGRLFGTRGGLDIRV